jgi:ribonucleotide monophosphatase NagD (HAD superfamily)
MKETFELQQFGESSKKADVRMTEIDAFCPFLSHEEKLELREDLKTLNIPSKYLGNILADGATTQIKLDIDGCLKSVEPQAAEYAKATVNTLMRLRIPVVFLTNDGGSLEAPKAEQLNALGYKYATPENVCVCTRSAAQHVDSINPYKLPVVALGTEQLMQGLREEGQNVIPFHEGLNMGSQPFIFTIGELYPRRDWTQAEQSAIERLIDQSQQVVLTNSDYSMPVKLQDGTITQQLCLGGLIEPFLEAYGHKIVDCGKPSVPNSLAANRRLQEVYNLDPNTITKDVLVGDFPQLDVKAQRDLENHNAQLPHYTPDCVGVLIETGGTEAGHTRSSFESDRRPDFMMQNYKYFIPNVLCGAKERYMHQMYSRGETPSQMSLVSAGSKAHKDSISIAESRKSSEEGKAKAKAERLERTHHIAEGRSQERPKDQNKGCCLVM